MSELNEPHPIVADASALIALCRTAHAETVFEKIKISTTNVCSKEISNGKNNYNEGFGHRNACESYHRYRTKGSTTNPTTIYVEPFKRGKSDQGESSIQCLIDEHEDIIRYVLIFDFPAIQRMEEFRKDNGYSFSIEYPNFPLEQLRLNRNLSDQQYCDGVWEMAKKENWTKRYLLKELASVSGIDCSQFP